MEDSVDWRKISRKILILAFEIVDCTTTHTHITIFPFFCPLCLSWKYLLTLVLAVFTYYAVYIFSRKLQNEIEILKKQITIIFYCKYYVYYRLYLKNNQLLFAWSKTICGSFFAMGIKGRFSESDYSLFWNRRFMLDEMT